MHDSHFDHDIQLETVGGVCLTADYVCPVCGWGTSHEHFHRHAMFPAQDGADERLEETIAECGSKTHVQYRQLLVGRLKELTAENVPCPLSQNEQVEILTELIEKALRGEVTACTGVALHSGLSRATAVADLIEGTLVGRTSVGRPLLERQQELALGGSGIRQDGSWDSQDEKDRD